jgi:hypothetical protein
MTALPSYRRETGWSDADNRVFVQAASRNQTMLTHTLPHGFHIRQYVAEARQRLRCNSTAKHACTALLQKDNVLHEFQRATYRAHIAAWDDATKTTMYAANEAPFNGDVRSAGVSGTGAVGSCWRDRTQIMGASSAVGLVGWSAFDLALSRVGDVVWATSDDDDEQKWWSLQPDSGRSEFGTRVAFHTLLWKVGIASGNADRWARALLLFSTIINSIGSPYM